MGPEERGFDGDGDAAADAVNDPEHLQFVFRVESVAALDFEGGRPHGHHFPYADHGLGIEFVFGGPVEQVGGIEDAAAAPGDFLVGQAAQLVQEFTVPAAGPDDMGVAVAETGNDEAPLGIQRLPAAGSGVHGTVIGDPAFVDGQEGIFQQGATFGKLTDMRDCQAHSGYFSWRRKRTDFSMKGCM